ncbi:MAG: RNA polymerase subunit sigma-70 [Solirubrobacteraceae bacterium]
MTTTVLERASAGDELAFRELTEPFRRELEFHCYRMLGSVQDAEDALQETMLAAWRALADFERRSSLRTWLYRIATNRCLNVLRDGGRRPHSIPPLRFEIPAPTRMSDPRWLEPYPDDRLGWLADSQPGPAARYESREAIELAFISALQRLPARQRAALVLRDVLGFHAAETAAMLETSVEGVKSALKRARVTIEQQLGDPTQRVAPPPAASVEEQELVEKFARAFLADDIDGMVALVTENAWFRMPPARHEYHGPELIGAFLTAVAEGHSGQSSRLIATRANGLPAFGTYYIDPLSGLVGQSGLLVLSPAGARLADLTWFLGPGYLERFDLPSAPFVDAPVSKAP